MNDTFLFGITAGMILVQGIELMVAFVMEWHKKKIIEEIK